MMRSVLAVAAFSALSAFSTTSIATAQGAAANETTQLEGIAALVNDEPISFYDLRQRVRMLLVTLGTEPTPEIQQQMADTALNQLVDERLQLQLAAEFELEIADDDIANSIERIAQQSGSNKAELENQFAGAGISLRTLEEQIRADIAWRRIMSGRFGTRIRISRNQIEDQMNRLQASARETSYQIGEIFLFAPDEETKLQAATAAQSLIQQLQAGTPFESAAQQFSSSPTASTGGDMGWVSVSDLPPTLAGPVSEADNAGIIGPIIAENGIYILSLRGRREPQEAMTNLELMQIVATDNELETLEAAMDDMRSCDTIDRVADRNDGILIADLGEVRMTELDADAQAKLERLDIGGHTSPFQIDRGWASIVVCDREDGVENMPTDEQLEDQLYGRELSMISERELRNARLEATILQ